MGTKQGQVAKTALRSVQGQETRGGEENSERKAEGQGGAEWNDDSGLGAA